MQAAGAVALHHEPASLVGGFPRPEGSLVTEKSRLSRYVLSRSFVVEATAPAYPRSTERSRDALRSSE